MNSKLSKLLTLADLLNSDESSGNAENHKKETGLGSDKIITLFERFLITQENPFIVGKKYLLRTVTHITVGEVDKIIGSFLIMKKSCWVADTGRFADALKEGTYSEVEMHPENGCGVNWQSLIDFFELDTDLPMETTK